MNMKIVFFKKRVEIMLLQTPGFPAQPFNPVPVHRFGKGTGRNGKTNLYRRGTFGSVYNSIKNFIGKNSKHLPFAEKCLNRFPAFQAFGP